MHERSWFFIILCIILMGKVSADENKFQVMSSDQKSEQKSVLQLSFHGSKDDKATECWDDRNTIDGMFQQRRQATIQSPLVAYPKTEKGITDFVLYSCEEINRFIDKVISHYQ